MRTELINLYQSEIENLRPFEGEKLKQIKDFYKIGTTYSSNAIEGNTLTESETKVILEDGLTVAGKPLRDIYETVGHGESYEYLFEIFRNPHITEENILYLHKLFYQKIDPDYAGKYRDMDVIITGSKYPVNEFSTIKTAMKEFCEWLKLNEKNYNAVKFSALAHKKFVFIHPFKDGNGRVARLLTNLILIKNGYLPIIIPPILRSEYICSLEKAHIDDSDFVNFIAEQEIESQKDILRLFHIPLPKINQQRLDDFDLKI